ncbi:MAG: HIT family protein [Acidimicrobiales bacterium]|nr:HIT family protein [Acidimicrobiales bacterium]MCB9371406.1 HIT family protein [Microthrixaceae bacterium]
MATIFTRIIRGELPGRFLWRDERCVVFLSINPLQPGHSLVVPVDEVDHWVDLDPELVQHLTGVAQHVARAQQAAFSPEKVGLMIAGLEVPHVHLHVVPIRGVHDLDFANADTDPDPADLDRAAATLRDALRAAGHAEVAGD